MHQRQLDAADHSPWRTVLAWPPPSPGFTQGLEPPAKLVWLYLWQLAGGVDRRAVIHAVNVAVACGLSDTAVRRALKSLKARDLIDIPDRFKGEITVYVNDPLIAARARLVPAVSHGQGELFPPGERRF